MNTTQSRLLTLVLLGLITLFSIHLVDRWLGGARADMTNADLYSLTDGTEAILDKMREEGVKPLDLRLYFSETTGKTLPKFIKDFVGYERYLRALLGEYERAAGGKIRVDFIDPLPDSDEAEQAAEDGLDGKTINQEGDLFFFGLALETQTGSKDSIEFLWPQDQENVEYEISKKMYGLLWPSRQRVGVLSSLQVLGGSQDPFMAQMLAAQGRSPEPKWIAMQVLEELYDVSAVPADTDEIGRDEYDLLVVIHPKDLPQKTQFAIDQWVVGGGNALIFEDPYSIADRPPQNPQQPWAALQYKPASSLQALLNAWGLERAEDEFVVDLELAVRRPLSQRGPSESVVVDLELTEGGDEDSWTQDLPIFQGMQNLRFLMAGPLRETGTVASPSEDDAEDDSEEESGASGGDPASDDLTRTVLAKTTSSGSTLQILPGFGGGGALAYTDLNQGAKLRDAVIPGSEPVALAYLLQGRFPTAFEDGVTYPSQEPERPPGLPPGVDLPPPEGTEMLHKDPLPVEERAEASVIVFTDVDFIGDAIAFVQNPFGIVQAANDNHKVLLNSIDFLLGSQELMAVRAKKSLSRPFLLFDDIEAEAEKETLDREREIRTDIETFQAELRGKQSEITQRNAALFQKKLQDEVDELNERIRAANGELRDIRRSRRAALEREESRVRFAVMGWMPLVVLGLGIFRLNRRRQSR